MGADVDAFAAVAEVAEGTAVTTETVEAATDVAAEATAETDAAATDIVKARYQSPGKLVLGYINN